MMLLWDVALGVPAAVQKDQVSVDSRPESEMEVVGNKEVG